MKPTVDVPISLDLEVEDLALVEAGLRLMLMIEDDPETIDRLKSLLERVRGGRVPQVPPRSEQGGERGADWGDD